MTWSAPMTAVANATFTAAQFNQYVRDNLNATAPALATTSGQYFTATGTNAIAARMATAARVDTSQTTTSVTYTDLATAGPSVTVTTGALALVHISLLMANNGANGTSAASFAISGATTRSAATDWGMRSDGMGAGSAVRYGISSLQVLTPGSNTFTMKYEVGSGTGTFSFREIIVVPF